MTVYYRTYYEDTLKVDDNVAGTFTGITQVEFFSGIGASPGETLLAWADYINIDDTLKFIGQTVDGDILAEPFNDLAAWTEDSPGGICDSSIQWGTALRQECDGDGAATTDITQSVVASSTIFTFEFDYAVDSQTDNVTSTLRVDFTDGSYIVLTFNMFGTDTFTVNVNGQSDVISVTTGPTFKTYRVMISTSPIVDPYGVGGGWFLF